MTTKLSIVIPIYNDYESLVTLAEWLTNCHYKNMEFVIFNNGSTDRKVQEFLDVHSIHYRSLSNNQNLGFGGGIQYAINELESEWVGWMPGNLKVRPQDLLSILCDFNPSSGTFIKAKRINRGNIPQIKTWIAGLIQSCILRTNMFDTGGTPTFCEKSFISHLVDPPKDFVFESYTLFVARKRNLKVVRPKIPYGVRVFGNSHWQRGIRSEVQLMLKIINSSRKWRKHLELN